MTIKIIVPMTDLYDFDPTGINDDATIIAHAKELLTAMYFDGDADNWVRNAVVIRNKDEDSPGFDRIEFDLTPCESAF